MGFARTGPFRATANLSRGPLYPERMARRRDRELIYQARRAGLVARLTSCGVATDRAEDLVAAWEAHATASGLARDGEAYWDEAWPWLEPRRWTRPRPL